MERISLPVRTATTRAWVAIPIAGAIILAMLLWMADVAALSAAQSRFFGRFRQVVLTRRPIQRISNGVLLESWTLFQEGGVYHALQSDAVLAMTRLDRWDGEMRYLFARGLWREYVAPRSSASITPGGLDVATAATDAVSYLRAAVRCEPMNAFYRQTLAEVLAALPDADMNRAEIDRLMRNWPPQNAWGQMRLAELSTERDAVLRHGLRALQHVSVDITSGLLDTATQEAGKENPLPLGNLVKDRVFNVLFDRVGDYNLWSVAGDFRDQSPEVHWLAAAYLRDRSGRTPAESAARQLLNQAEQERQAVVTTVADRLRVEERVSTRRALYEILNPFVRPNYEKRFLMGRELELAARVLRETNRPDDAIRLYRAAIARRPGDIGPRIALADTQLDRAQMLSAKVREYRAAGNTAAMEQADRDAREATLDAKRQIDMALLLNPRSEGALAMRTRLGGATPAPPPRP